MVSEQRAAPAISVVIPAHNAASTLADCLSALGASIGADHEVIVVDDASNDETAAIAERGGARVILLERQAGAAVARNMGSARARAGILFFTDADVLVTPTALARALDLLRRQPEIGAVFGSYTATTVHANFASVYKNLIHHATHQAARPEATTFWSGAGAVRASAFWEVGGFDPADTRSADVEDIALGYRLTRAGYRIRVDRDLQVTHAKRYSFFSMVRSDLFHRAVPWTRLMLRERVYRSDLNTGSGSIASVGALGLASLALVAGWLTPSSALFWCAAGFSALFVALNRGLFTVFAHHAGWRFVALAIPMTAFYYLYATLGAAIGVASHLYHQRAPGVRATTVAGPGLAPPVATSLVLEIERHTDTQGRLHPGTARPEE